MTNYEQYVQVGEALASGADPALICATCPWDRNCLNPPAMSPGDVQKRMKETEDKLSGPDMRDSHNANRALASALLSAVVFAGKDTALQACPVLCARLKSSGGRQLADMVRKAMQSWDDSK